MHKYDETQKKKEPRKATPDRSRPEKDSNKPDITPFVISDPDFKKPLGAGSYAKAYRCSKMGEESGSYYVVKVIPRKSVDSRLLESEINIMKILMEEKSHPNLLRVAQIIDRKDEDQVYIITGLCDAGSLEDLLQKRVVLQDYEIQDLFRGIAEGLKTLRKLKIVHRDMKLENTYLHTEHIHHSHSKHEETRLRPVIGDFGFSKILKERDQTGTTLGTPFNMAPELQKFDEYGPTVDIWALGIMLYQVCFGDYPFRIEELHTDFNRSKGRYTIPPRVLTSVECLELIEACLQFDPKHRLKAEEVAASPFFGKRYEELQRIWVEKPVNLSVYKQRVVKRMMQEEGQDSFTCL